MKSRLLKRIAALALMLCIYPACVIIFTLSYVLKSDFEGGRNGKLDAYRHSLASATVAYTLGEWAVDVTTCIFESSGKDSNVMDAHNNRIGARIGSKVKTFSDIEPAVRHAVDNGQVSASDSDQITWLAPSKWRDRKFW
jgi:preprotein translocase subunit SecF